MKRFLKFMVLTCFVSIIFISCEKKPLTLDENTSMKTLLKASDKEITDLVISEAKKMANISSEDLTVDYILRDTENQAIAVKVLIEE